MFLGSKEAQLSAPNSSNGAWRYFYLLPQLQNLCWQQWKHTTSLGRERQMSPSALPKLPAIRSSGLLPFPLWGVHKQSTCLLFAENLNTVKMTEKKGSLVATPLATEMPFRWRLCCVWHRFGRQWLRAFTQLLQHVQRPVCPSDPLQYFHWDSPCNSIIVSLIFKKSLWKVCVWCAEISLNWLFWWLF